MLYALEKPRPNVPSLPLAFVKIAFLKAEGCDAVGYER